MFNAFASRALLLLCTAAALHAMPASAADFPNRPIRLLVPFAPGGSTDVVARMVAKEMSTTLGQQVVVDNRAGASGAIATEAVATAAPDGYTLCYCTTGSTVILPLIDPKLGYRPDKDLAPVSHLVNQPFVVVVRSDLNVSTLKDFVALVKANPTRFSFGSPGTATPSHLTGELLKQAAHIDMTHVPYRGDQPAVTDLLGGQIDAMMLSSLTVKQLVSTGKVRPLAVSSSTRLKDMPDLPTIAESGYPGFETHNFHAVFAPAGTPPDVLQALHASIVAALKTPEVADRLNREGLLVVGSGPQALAASMVEENHKWAAVAKLVSLSRD